MVRDGSALAGFLLALPETADYGSDNYRYFQARYDRFVYVDRIVVDDRFRRAGVGAALYRYLDRCLPAGCPRIACEVNVRPPNAASLAFHRKLGFDPVGEQDTENGAKRVCLLVKTLRDGC